MTSQPDLVERVVKTIFSEAERQEKEHDEYVGTLGDRDHDWRTVLDGDFELGGFARAAIKAVLEAMIREKEKIIYSDCVQHIVEDFAKSHNISLDQEGT